MDEWDVEKGEWLDLVVKTLRRAFFETKATEAMPPELQAHEEFQRLYRDLQTICHFATSLAGGELSESLRLRGSLAGSLKMLQGNLRHLTWQTQMIAKGDFSQRVDFMGAFSQAFNSMVEALAQSQKALRESRQQYRHMVAVAPFPLVVTSMIDHRIIFINDKAAQLYGVTAEEAIGKNARDYYRESADMQLILEELALHGAVENRIIQMRNDRDEVYFGLLSAVVSTFAGEPVRLVAINDITARHKMENELRRMATTDELTGCFNRRYFMELAEQTWQTWQTQRADFSLALLMLDLDHFKSINDRFGHAGGDQVLRTACQRLRSVLRDGDILGRIGGEEFAVLLPGCGRDGAWMVAERLRRAMVEGEMVLESGERPVVTVSVGVAVPEDAGQTFSDLLRCADVALYRAKDRGRNCVQVWSPAHSDDAQ
ncbi:sensor domain-containing diguanylate cyclase [Heliophilum fasciatum]|uniref:PAS domain S-box-containing protein/diguanylate cyclase (GGDEF)-like protein n=1 Tax=Heliophilum fasciatum TaxID=35700 RepID=A0A4R2RYA2_9FIRM|nr:diguanylate cyclase [Heliophilum fasciatum]MCW2276966.1 diguanylate cyclase (GGDEF)-like protein/PAS domain S-box-containing protein [Heliophilum fasciatum]TCP68508.1 PAS domain S-box-containing protein/diguanylate cyclase (GGDEF)-like protein [Heliophilum fasciatum]